MRNGWSEGVDMYSDYPVPGVVALTEYPSCLTTDEMVRLAGRALQPTDLLRMTFDGCAAKLYLNDQQIAYGSMANGGRTTWWKACRHGTILYGAKCLRCERGET